MRRTLAALLVVLGIVAIGLGIASATVWRSSETVTATMPAQPDTPVVLVVPGVLGMVSPETVTVRASAPDAPVVLAFAPASDVAAWVGPAAHTDVVGLASWTELAVERVDGEGTVPNPAGADLWTAEVTGQGEVTLDLVPDPGEVTLLVATDGTQPAPRVTLSWPATVTTPYLVPLLVGGLILALVGLGLLTWDFLVRREVRARTAARQQKAAADVTETATMRVVEEGGPMASAAPTAARLTRRQLRERDRAQAASDPRAAPDGPIASTGGTVGAGIVPAALDPERHRALRHVELDEPVYVRTEVDAAVRDAGPARGSAVVPGVRDAARHRDSRDETGSWRALWDVQEEDR